MLSNNKVDESYRNDKKKNLQKSVKSSDRYIFNHVISNVSTTTKVGSNRDYLTNIMFFKYLLAFSL